MDPRFNDKSFTFLIVEDDMIMQKMLASALRNIGYRTIHSAYNGRDACELLQRYPIDIILSDLMMPVMDGLELLSKVRASDKYWSIPFIMISSESRQSRIIFSTEDEIEAYIVKPLTTDILAQRIDTALTNRYAPDLYNEAIYRAKSDLRRGEMGEALSAFQEANAYNPKRTSPYFYMGKILEEFGQYDRAIENYKKCDDQSNSLYVRAFDGLAHIYLERKDFIAATDALKKACKVSPANTDRTIKLGKCCLRSAILLGAKST